MKRTLVTSALPYANGPLHIGHLAGAYLPADIYTRYKRLKGEDVIHICGTDEHGVAITIAAEEKGINPKELVDFYYKNIKESFEKLGIKFDNFSRTSKPLHYKMAQNFFLRLYDRGYIYRRESRQFYCPNCRRFLPDRYVEGTCPHCGYEKARGDQCEKCGRWLEPTDLVNPRCSICGTTPILRETFHYYFKLTELEESLKKWLKSKQNWKENVRNTALSWIKEGLKDRPITRDLSWGVPVPLDEAKGKVLYVWFDAPIGYISSTIEWAERIGDRERWKLYWMDEETRIVHFIGKDNIVFHAIIWPAMLMAHGDYNLPADIPANEFLNLMGDKLSTSKKWAVWVPDLIESFPPDYVRFGIATVLPETKDADFNFYEFRKRINSDLADNIGNLVMRTLSFIKNYLGGRIPEPGQYSSEDLALLKIIEEAPQKIGENIENFRLRKALKELLDFSSEGNRYFDMMKPWVTRKFDKERTSTTLYLCASLIYSLSILMEPFLPFSAPKMREMLNHTDSFGWDDAGKLNLQVGRELRKVEILFKKIDEKKIEVEVNKLLKMSGRIKEMKELIKFEDFNKLEIKIGKIIEAQKIEGTEKLLLLKVDVGGEIRTLVAGIAKDYSPEDIVGIEVPVLVNLEPRKIRGYLSQGMILAAVDKEGKVVLLKPDREVEPGTSVS